jgi:hypothetical protein
VDWYADVWELVTGLSTYFIPFCLYIYLRRRRRRTRKSKENELSELFSSLQI